MKKIIFSLGLILVFTFTQAQDFRFGKVSDQEIKQTEHPKDKSADAAILYREMKTDFDYNRDRGWYLVTNYFERIEIYSKDGAEYANKTIDIYKGDKQNDALKKLRAFTYNLDDKGKVNRIKLESNGIVDEDVNHFLKQTKITMPDVQEGSVIEIRYTIESPFIMNIDEYKFQELVPVDKVFMTFSAPEDFRFQTYQRGWLPIDMESTIVDKTITLMVTEEVSDGSEMGFPRKVTRPRKVDMKNVIYTINMSDVPAIEAEPYVGNIENYMSGLQFELSSADTGSGIQSFSVTWDDVSKSIYQSNSFGGELRRSNYYKQDIEKLLKGVSDPMKKTMLIYSYVQQKMNWNGNIGVFTKDGVRKAYNENTGNAAEINLIMASMLNYAQVNASPVLVSTKDHGIPLFPTINGFNYVISAVELPTGTILLDATNKNSEIDVLHSYVMNGFGRLLRKENESAWISLNPKSLALRQTILNVKLNDEQKIEGTAQHRYTGNYALSYRNSFKNLASSEWDRKLEKMYDHVELSEVSFENLDNPMEPVLLNFDFISSVGVEKVSGKIFMSPLFFLSNTENPFKSENRKYPVDFGFPYRSQVIMNFILPDGYQVESFPESTMSTLGDMGSYKFLGSQKGNVIQFSVDLTIKQATIAESDYEDLRSFFELLVEKESEKIVITKG